MMTVVYLIRHGAYENPKNIFHGRLPGFPLSADGKKTILRIAKYFVNKQIGAIFSSRLTRAWETADIFAKHLHLSVITDRRLLEVRSPLQGKPISYIRDTLDWSIYDPKYIALGGERLQDVFVRMDQFIRNAVRAYAGKAIVVVSHGDPIMSLVTIYGGNSLPKRFSPQEWYVPMASGFKIEFDSSGKPVSITKLR